MKTLMKKPVAYFSLSFFSAALIGCESQAPEPVEQRLGLQFQSIAPAANAKEQAEIRATDRVWLNGQAQAIAYQRLLQVGQKDNGEIYGQVKDAKDQPILAADGSPYLCNGTDSGVGSGLDHISILQKNNRLYLVSQFECAPGAIYLNELEQSSNGQLPLKKGTLRYISQAKEFGGWVHCAGITTPWQSHLGSEEYEPDANLDAAKPYTNNK